LISSAGVLVSGDYLSPVEIPMVRAIDRYAATLERLRPLVERATTVVPGHGAPLSRGEALRVLDEDAAYVAALGVERADAPLPRGLRSATQRRIHEENVVRFADG
jgi:glyoxylase-like metal-dependent hydrolase (beta-lactamase superfamily II)